MKQHEITEQLDTAWSKFQTSFDRAKRKYYYRLGERLIQLRMTFGKGKNGDAEFDAFCEEYWPRISRKSRDEYMAYRKQFGTPAEWRAK
jgi:hypothetical protein